MNMTYKIRQIEGDTLTPIHIFQQLQGDKSYLLESSMKHEASGRYSIIAANPYLELFAVDDQTYAINPKTGERTDYDKNLFDTLESLTVTLDVESVNLPMIGGGIGYIGYDTIQLIENIPTTTDDVLKMRIVTLCFLIG